MTFTNETMKRVAACRTHEEAMKVVKPEELLELAQRFCRSTTKKLDAQKRMREAWAEMKKG